MKAITYTNYGNADVLLYNDVNKPTMGPDRLMIQVKNASLNMADVITMTGMPKFTRLMTNGLGANKVKKLGCDFAGIVTDIGVNVKGYKVGDRVFGDLSNIGVGSFAEYVCTTSDTIALIPDELSFEEASTLSVAGCTALNGIDAANIKPGDKILINGASGCVGMLAVQLAKSKGATVTGVCSTNKMDFVKEIGADKVIDYKKENFLQLPDYYDVVIDTAIHSKLSDYKRIMTDQSIYLLIGGNLRKLMLSLATAPLISRKKGKQFKGISSKATHNDLVRLANYVKDGTITVKIDQHYSIEETGLAMAYYESKKSIGKVVIDV